MKITFGMRAWTIVTLLNLLFPAFAEAGEIDYSRHTCLNKQFWLETIQELNESPLWANESVQIVDIKSAQLVSAEKRRLICKARVVISDSNGSDEVLMRFTFSAGNLGHPIYEWEFLE